MKHWTEQDIESFRYRLGADFIEDLEARMKALGLNHASLAKMKGVSQARVSQVFNDPGNLTLDSMIEWTRAAGLKVSVVVYDDRDAKNELGPIPAEMFQRCWEICGKPSTEWQLEVSSAGSFTMIAGEQSNIFFADAVAFADTVLAGVTGVLAKYSPKPSDEGVLDLAA
jgi:transcriptional regulator with XRE-family HTH domain